jgi:hypothetical protein
MLSFSVIIGAVAVVIPWAIIHGMIRKFCIFEVRRHRQLMHSVLIGHEVHARNCAWSMRRAWRSKGKALTLVLVLVIQPLRRNHALHLER